MTSGSGHPVASTAGAGTGALTVLDAAAARRWAVLCRAAFAARRAEIDALNVFPVPDGDTGTNLFLTLDAALDTAVDALPAAGRPALGGELATQSQAFARALLLTARGNSGVILSQLFRGIADEVAAQGSETLDGRGLARALRRADDLAWAGVHRPVEGTILSVSRAAACAAEAAGTTTPDLYGVSAAVLRAARDALARTPDQLPALARAGVVDAGGTGYVVLLEALDRVVRADLPPDDVADLAGHVRERAEARRAAQTTSTRPAHPATGAAPGAAAGPAYELMFLLRDSDDAAVAALRERLDGLGDSLVVVADDSPGTGSGASSTTSGTSGTPGTWRVHVHVDDVGAAIEAALDAGRPSAISVTHFGSAATGGGHRHPTAGVAVVACASGEGLASLFAGEGARVVATGPRRRASAGQLLEAVRATGAAAVLLLPNDADAVLAAEAAVTLALEEGVTARVVAARTAVQGIAALAVFDPGLGLDENAAAMSAAATATRHGAVTAASRDAETDAGPCRAGDALGLVGRDVEVVRAPATSGAAPLADALRAVGHEVVERMLAAGGEVLTLVVGEDAPAGIGEAVEAAARAEHPDLEIVRLYGGQSVYPLLVGVE